jgi:SPW repeat
MVKPIKKQRMWQDVANLFLGIWALLTPWIVGQHPGSTVVVNYVVVGILIIFCAGAALLAFRPWQEGINMMLGAWLLISPWWLEFRTVPGLVWSAVVTGVLVILCSAVAAIQRFSDNNDAAK